MHLDCLEKHCASQFLKAVVNPKFTASSICEMGCGKVYDQDPSPEKLEYQNCTTKCALTYETVSGDAFTACAMENGCMEMLPIPGSCPYKKEHIQPNSSLASLTGEFWQHRGKNALWDCYPCQHIHAMELSQDDAFCAQTIFPGKGPVKAPCWSYTYSYDLYLVGDKTKTFEQTWQLPGDVPDGEPIDIYYNYMGSWHNETWYILQATENYVLLGDCSYMMDWIDVGSIVWVRPGHQLSDAENAEIARVYKELLGWDYEDFCYDTHGSESCRDPPVADSQPAKPLGMRQPRPSQRRAVLTPTQIEELQSQINAVV
jgi:hypothetical protein